MLAYFSLLSAEDRILKAMTPTELATTLGTLAML
jgi:hypothetical protein